MKDWVSMFDDTIVLKLNPSAKKSKGREQFLYTENKDDVIPAVKEQFRRYLANPTNYKLPKNPLIADAIRKFDQTGADGKLKYLKKAGIDINIPLKNLWRADNAQ